MKGKIELYNISFLILKVELHFKERLPHMVEHFKRIAPYLRQQSEECLNLNLYVPLPGKYPT